MVRNLEIFKGFQGFFVVLSWFCPVFVRKSMEIGVFSMVFRWSNVPGGLRQAGAGAEEVEVEG